MAQEHTRLMKANFHGSELGINGSEVYTSQNPGSRDVKILKESFSSVLIEKLI